MLKRKGKNERYLMGIYQMGKSSVFKNYSNCCVDCAHVFIPSSSWMIHTSSVCWLQQQQPLYLTIFILFDTYTRTQTHTYSQPPHPTHTQTHAFCWLVLSHSLFALDLHGQFFYSLAHFTITQASIVAYVHEREIVARSKTS